VLRKKQDFKNTRLSANTAAQYVNDLAGAIQCQRKENYKNFVAYCLAMEKNTDVYNTAQPAVFIQGVNEDYRLTEGRPEEVRIKKQLLVTFSHNW
jgi:hypothetical protein